MTNPAFILVLAGAFAGRDARSLPQSSMPASSRLGCGSQSPCRLPMRARPYWWPTGAAEAFRSSTPRAAGSSAEHDVGRGLADLAMLKGGRACSPSMKHRTSSC